MSVIDGWSRLKRALGAPPPGVSREAYRRWRAGNEGERDWWLTLPEQAFVDQERVYRALAGQLQALFPAFGLGQRFRALQIGCAVQDVIFFLEGGERYALDPLATFYKAHFARSRDPRVDYREGVGESLPFPDRFFDVVICQNLLDHVASYEVVLREVKRVLTQPNVVYFGTDVYDEAAARVRWERRARGELFDPPHPHTFTETSLDAILAAHGFVVTERWPRQPSGKDDESWRYCLAARG